MNFLSFLSFFFKYNHQNYIKNLPILTSFSILILFFILDFFFNLNHNHFSLVIHLIIFQILLKLILFQINLLLINFLQSINFYYVLIIFLILQNIYEFIVIYKLYYLDYFLFDHINYLFNSTFIIYIIIHVITLQVISQYLFLIFINLIKFYEYYFFIQIFFYYDFFFQQVDFFVFQITMDFNLFMHSKLIIKFIITIGVFINVDQNQIYSFLFSNFPFLIFTFIYFLSFFHLHFS